MRPLAILLATVVTAAAAYAQRPEQPNFLLIYADDMGWQDMKVYDNMETNVVGGFGGTNVFDTPYMDALATEGVLFREAYSPACVCAPSRAAMLSSQYPARLNITTVSGGSFCPQPDSLGSRMMGGYHNQRLETETTTLPELLSAHGYLNGHIGKWHLSGPGPLEHGFHVSEGHRGVTSGMADRLTGFATTNATDPYQLQDITGAASTNGYAFDRTTQNALDFLARGAATNQPFFCYFATWLVHAPWHQRTERLLQKYAERMGFTYPLTGDEVFAEGQNNPFYAAMVETFDYNLHQLLTYLRTTDDPRWPGHKLIENTYVILTSDNGGMENGDANGKVTDNYPLDKGKINQEEGGTRVPFLAVGPGIASNLVSDVMISGLDLMPTILSLAGISDPGGMDGLDLSALLLGDPTNAKLVTNDVGEVRNTLFWSYPHGTSGDATIRKGGWKLFYNFDHVNNGSLDEYRLYQLYDTNGVRVDIEEKVNLRNTETNRAAALGAELKAWLDEVEANVPHYNPKYTSGILPNQSLVPAATAHGRAGSIVWVEYETDKAAMARVDLLYTLNGDRVDQSWLRRKATITQPGRAEVSVPEGTTHYVFNLIDENNFLVSYPDVGTGGDGIPDSYFAFSYAEAPYVNYGPQDSIFLEDFTSGSMGINLDRDSVGFCKESASAWEINGGALVNTSQVNSKVSEGAAAVIIDLSALENSTADQFTLSFDHNLSDYNETLYVHVWGYVDHSSSPDTSIMNLGAQDGNAWEKASPDSMTSYNFGNSNGVFIGIAGTASDAAVSIAGLFSPGTYTETFDLSGYTSAPNTLGAYDYLVLGFTRKIGGTAPAAMIDNVKITVPTSNRYARWAHDHGLTSVVDNSAPHLNTVTSGSLLRDSVGLHKEGDSAWTVSEGLMQNASSSATPHARVSEGALAHIFDLSAFDDIDHSQLSLRFDYDTAASNERLYVHLWGYVDVNSTPSTRTMNLGGSNGNAWESAGGAMIPYNLGRPNGVFASPAGSASDAAVGLTGSTGPRSFSHTFDLSTFSTAPDTVAGYDHLVIGFTREATSASASVPTVVIKNVELSVVGGDTIYAFVREEPQDGFLENPDDDDLVNLLEYAFGGDPTNGADAGIHPTLNLTPDGTPSYVFRRRIDHASRGLVYTVQCATNIINGAAWTTNGCVETGRAPIDTEFESVTNRLLTGDAVVGRLRVESGQ